VRLNAKGLDKLRDVAEARGVSVREYLEALMHFAISQHERPGSWEAETFRFENYDQRGERFADRGF
jgi:hypothetical protein